MDRILIKDCKKNEKYPIAIFFFPGLVQIQNSGLECQDLWIFKIQAIYNDAKMGQIYPLFLGRSHMGELALYIMSALFKHHPLFQSGKKLLRPAN